MLEKNEGGNVPPYEPIVSIPKGYLFILFFFFFIFFFSLDVYSFIRIRESSSIIEFFRD